MLTSLLKALKMEPLFPGSYYHIYNHANGNENLFAEQENYRFFLQQYQKHIRPVADTLAYCLMPNHFHVLIKIRSTEELMAAFPKLMDGSNAPGFGNLTNPRQDLPGFGNRTHPRQDLPGFGNRTHPRQDLPGFENLTHPPQDLPDFGNLTHPPQDLPGFENLEGLAPAFVSKRFSNLFNSYTKAFNKKYNRKGSLFMKNFKRKLISSNAQLMTALIYIHVNPVHHGFTDQFTDWQWSSWHSLVEGTDGFLNQQVAVEIFGGVKEMFTHHLTFEKEKLRRMVDELE